MVIDRRCDLSDAWQTNDFGQPSILWHLFPKHQKRGNPRCQGSIVQHIKPTRRRISVNPPLHARVGVQIVKPDRQFVVIRVLRIMLYLEIADRAVGVVKDRRCLFFFHMIRFSSARREIQKTLPPNPKALSKTTRKFIRVRHRGDDLSHA